MLQDETFEQYHARKETERTATEQPIIDPKEVEEHERQKWAQRDKDFRKWLADIREENRSRNDQIEFDLLQGFKENNQALQKRMEQEITEAQERVATEIKEKYRNENGMREWNDSTYEKGLRELLTSLKGE